MAQLYYQGHGSLRFTTDKGTVLYLDPFAGDGYDLPANLILVTHSHHDHNKIELVPQAPDCRIITFREALVEGEYHNFTVEDIKIQATQAYNQNHAKEECVGFILTMDGVTVYCAGDTSTTEEMHQMAALNLDYALLPTDGLYNMDNMEAAACAQLIGAKHTIPIHNEPDGLFDLAKAEAFDTTSKLLVQPGETLNL